VLVLPGRARFSYKICNLGDGVPPLRCGSPAPCDLPESLERPPEASCIFPGNLGQHISILFHISIIWNNTTVKKSKNSRNSLYDQEESSRGDVFDSNPKKLGD